jgi:hypothetical protein
VINDGGTNISANVYVINLPAIAKKNGFNVKMIIKTEPDHKSRLDNHFCYVTTLMNSYKSTNDLINENDLFESLTEKSIKNTNVMIVEIDRSCYKDLNTFEKIDNITQFYKYQFKINEVEKKNKY